MVRLLDFRGFKVLGFRALRSILIGFGGSQVLGFRAQRLRATRLHRS